MTWGYLVKGRHNLILIFSAVYTLTFTVTAFYQGNFEFVYYTVLMAALIYIVFVLDQKFQLGPFIVMNLSLLGFLHLAGGNYTLHGVRLYDVYLIQGFLRYDNIIHTYGTFTATLALYNVMLPFTHERVTHNFGIFSLQLVLMSIGIGALNELVEFFAVIFLGASEQVGGYANNALDLLFNTVGAIMACIVIYGYRHRQHLLPRINARLKKNS